MTAPVDASPFVEKAIAGGLPPDTIMEAMTASVMLQNGQPYDLGEGLGLGNMTGVRMVVTPIPREGRDGILKFGKQQVLVSIVGWDAYPFQLDEPLLHWTYVKEKLTRRGRVNDCDAVALTLLLGIVLRREVGVGLVCNCLAHRGLGSGD